MRKTFFRRNTDVFQGKMTRRTAKRPAVRVRWEFQIHPSLQCFVNSCSASEKDVRLTCFAFKIVVLRIKNPPFPRQKIWRQNGGKNLVSRFSNAEKTEFLIKKNSSNSEESEELCDRYTIDECTSSLSHISNFFILDSACFLFSHLISIP